MRIIARRTLIEFIESKKRHADHKALSQAVQAWFAEAKKAEWSSMSEIKELYRSASVVSADRVVFNIKGNDFRLVAAVDFKRAILFIKWIGTHKDYDKIDVKKVKYNG
jgi:mRNA interferase HigB